MDLLTSAQQKQEAVGAVRRRLGQPVLAISAATGEGVDALLERCWASLDRTADDRAGWGRESG